MDALQAFRCHKRRTTHSYKHTPTKQQERAPKTPPQPKKKKKKIHANVSIRKGSLTRLTALLSICLASSAVGATANPSPGPAWSGLWLSLHKALNSRNASSCSTDKNGCGAMASHLRRRYPRNARLKNKRGDYEDGATGASRLRYPIEVGAESLPSVCDLA